MYWSRMHINLKYYHPYFIAERVIIFFNYTLIPVYYLDRHFMFYQRKD